MVVRVGRGEGRGRGREKRDEGERERVMEDAQACRHSKHSRLKEAYRTRVYGFMHKNVKLGLVVRLQVKVLVQFQLLNLD